MLFDHIVNGAMRGDLRQVCDAEHLALFGDLRHSFSYGVGGFATDVRDPHVILEQIRTLANGTALGKEVALHLDADTASGGGRRAAAAGDDTATGSRAVEIAFLGLAHTTTVIMAWRRA